MPPSLEIACFNPTSALLAASSGASRIELCADGSVGGVTPSLADYVSLRHEMKVPIYVMIRPRGGSFVYTDAEFHKMKKDLLLFRDEGANGFVYGILDAQGRVDVEKCRELVELADGRNCTFHRAFDELSEDVMETALEELIVCGFSSVLTSGGKKTASEGREVLQKLVRLAGARIKIIVGGGVRSGLVKDLRSKTQASWYHSSAVVDGGVIASEKEVRALKEALSNK